jgi:phospholipid/cholesterol/gamma-HCH transport system ATP-binding protein
MSAKLKIRLRDVYKAFEDKKVLQGVDLDIPEGCSMVIMGGSGVGKSVLLKHIIGLLKPDRGTVFIEDTDLSTLSDSALNDLRRDFGMSFQEGALFDSMNVFENIAFPLKRHTRKTAAEVRARVEECLKIVNLRDVADKMPADLSGGMKRRVGFARAIALQPKILLFDEPTTGLDPVMTALIADTIRGLTDDPTVTAVTITHDLETAYTIGDTIAMLFRGRIVFCGSPQEFKDSGEPAVAQFRTSNPIGPWTEDEL